MAIMMCDRCGGVDTHYGLCPNEIRSVSYDPSEQDIIIEEFVKLLRFATKDGGAKRARGEKPPWWKDKSHLAAIFSHLAKYLKGELVDPDSGAHPMTHAGWRCLALSYQETNGMVDPAKKP